MSRYIINDYICPYHGKFDALVERDNAATAPCPVKLDHLESVASGLSVCGELSPWTLSAPMGRVKLGEPASRAKNDPHAPGQLDTRPLAEGMPKAEWDAINRQKGFEIDRERNRKAMHIDKKIIVGGGV